MLPPQTGIDAWLRYAALVPEQQAAHRRYSGIIPLRATATSPVHVAAQELQDGVAKILGQHIGITSPAAKASPSAIIVGTLDDFASAGLGVQDTPQLKEDGYWLSSAGDNVHIVGQNERGALYGAFQYLSLLAQGADVSHVSLASSPSAPIRWTNQWDNMDGSIERGYGGRSIFFRDGAVVQDMSRVRQYARLLASVGLNGCVVNNVNSDYRLLSDDGLEGLGRIADAMRPYGVRIGISVYFDAPREAGGLATSDPLDAQVVAWWDAITASIHQHVPDLVGFTIKANSEGQPGPLTYGRTLADAANMFARALRRHGDGVVMYRAFVYNHHLDESVWTNDRANAAVDYFDGLDGQFDDNVIVQVKFGPIDFQVREPPSPLLARLESTAVAIELMVAQEYLGQQSHYVYQPPLWKTVLDFDMRIGGQPSRVRDIVSGERHGWRRSGYVAVVNTGDDATWLGHHLCMSNLYGYGRLAWSPADDAEAVLRDWTRLTFGTDRTVVDTVTGIGMETWPTYESYSGNLGIQTLCDIIYTHYGPDPSRMDGNGWGQWTRADHRALGMDRTVATGSGNTAQYPPEVARVFEDIQTCPDELLLWFHHVPYTHRLKSGKTVIQHFYDAHYEGALNAQTFPARWSALEGLVDSARFEHVAFKLAYQAGHALVWRDTVCGFYHAKSGIADEAGRVGSHPYRIEAQDMQLSGYAAVPVRPVEAASGGRAVVATSSSAPAVAQTMLATIASGTYDIAVNYFDHLGGVSRYELSLDGKVVGRWKGDLRTRLGHDFSEFLDAHSATRVTFRGVEVGRGADLKITGVPDGKEMAPLDYVSLLPPRVVD